MGKKDKKKKDKEKTEQTVRKECGDISEERLIEIYSESFYRALKRLDEEKENAQKQTPDQKKGRLLWTDALLVLNLIFCPFKISKRFKLNNRMYDGILVVIISVGLKCFGLLTWAVGLGKFVYDLVNIFASGKSIVLFLSFIIDLTISFYGSFFYLAGKSFGEETESNKVYAYSASILALVSCVVSLIALLKG